MLDKKEKLVMSYLCDVCVGKKTQLISIEKIAGFASKKYLLSITELDDIMISLSKDNYVDFVVSDSKKGYYYCVTLTNKGITFKKDLKKERQAFLFLILRTLGLAVLSFIVGLLLNAIFKG